MTGLLVSVRSAEEALAALDGGADLIDVKEPQRGPLGRADDQVIRDVIRVVAGRRPVSAALGELADKGPVPPSGLTYVKWGLAGLALARPWRRMLMSRRNRLRQHNPGCDLVAVAYADWSTARAISLTEVFGFAIHQVLPVMLIDTWAKDGRTLLDFLDLAELTRIREECRVARIKLALAGSLSEAEIVQLGPLEPDWFAVRGAVCVGGREGIVDRERVRRLAKLIQQTHPSQEVTSPP